MRLPLKIFAAHSLPILLSACATWGTASVSNQNNAVAPQVVTAPMFIAITEGDISDKPYKVIADISVTVNKTTIFNADPTREAVDQMLREKASDLGADAVIFVRYGTVGISMMSWGSLDGKGRAVRYVR
jgi:hypothetical protein